MATLRASIIAQANLGTAGMKQSIPHPEESAAIDGFWS